MRRLLFVALLVVPVAAAPATAQIEIYLTDTPAGTAVDRVGGTAPYDVIRADRSQVVETPSTIDLGVVTAIECGSPDASTRAGDEDPTSPPASEVFYYLVRSTGGSYGDTDGKEKLASAGDCAAVTSPVCDRWNADYPKQATVVWTGDTVPANCDLGIVDPLAIEDGLRRTNLYRWLVGLPPVTENLSYSAKAQAAAVIMRGLGTLTHVPDPADPCYTADGDDGAGSSNLAAGYRSLADAVDGYMRDSGVPSLGHRRWLIYPRFSETGFGIVRGGSFGWFSAQWVFGFGPDPAPEFVAYPAPGDFPDEALLGVWSFSVDGADFSAATVTVTRVSDLMPMPVTGVYEPTPGFGLRTLAWDVTGWSAGESYDVRIDNVASAARTTYTYTTTLLACR